MRTSTLRALTHSALAALLLVGLTGPAAATPPAPAGPAAAFAATRTELARTDPPVTDAAVGRRWRSDFADLQRQLSGPAGLAVVPVGQTEGLTVGALRTEVAWSTAKVPLSVAALARTTSAKDRRKARKLVDAAITRSDNAAAEALWRRLGSGRPAARAVQKVIRRAGDRDTVVQHRRVRPGFTAFGQTRWALDDQARFAAGLRCLSGTTRVRKEMTKIVAGQRFGLGQVTRSRFGKPVFKGGWGPVGDDYLVRQVGILTASDGRSWGVAIMVRASSLSRGSRDLTAITHWLDRRLPSVRGGRC